MQSRNSVYSHFNRGYTRVYVSGGVVIPEKNKNACTGLKMHYKKKELLEDMRRLGFTDPAKSVMDYYREQVELKLCLGKPAHIFYRDCKITHDYLRYEYCTYASLGREYGVTSQMVGYIIAMITYRLEKRRNDFITTRADKTRDWNKRVAEITETTGKTDWILMVEHMCKQARLAHNKIIKDLAAEGIPDPTELKDNK